MPPRHFGLAVSLVLAAGAGRLTAQHSHPPAQAPDAADAARRLEATVARPGEFRLMDVSLDLLTAVGTSTERGAALRNLQGGGHDPRTRGFTLQNVELSLAGAVDPYFTAEAHLISFLDPASGETERELEESFLTTQGLPYALELEVGSFFTEFGRLNPTHPHAWTWQDQPLVNTRMFGPDGMRGPGVRVGWQLPTPCFTELHFGVQNATGEAMTSFQASEDAYAERPLGGRQFVDQDARSFDGFVYLLRAHSAFDLAAEHRLSLGASGLFGPNATGGQGETLIWGIDAAYRWEAAKGDEPRAFVSVEGEFLGRRFDAERQIDRNDPTNPGDDVAIPAARLEDWGGYAQVVYGWGGPWAVGLRGEWASGSGASYDAATDTLARRTDPFRADRTRVSPLVSYQPNEFARVRLQYNYDDADHLRDAAHSVWLGFEVAIGKHSAHD